VIPLVIHENEFREYTLCQVVNIGCKVTMQCEYGENEIHSVNDKIRYSSGISKRRHQDLMECVYCARKFASRRGFASHKGQQETCRPAPEGGLYSWLRVCETCCLWMRESTSSLHVATEHHAKALLASVGEGGSLTDSTTQTRYVATRHDANELPFATVLLLLLVVCLCGFASGFLTLLRLN